MPLFDLIVPFTGEISFLDFHFFRIFPTRLDVLGAMLEGEY